MQLIKKCNCRLLDFFHLDSDVWWNDYYAGLEHAISLYQDRTLKTYFGSDLAEIEQFRKNPSQFHSVYYVLQKN